MNKIGITPELLRQGFEAGYSQLRRKDVKACVADVMAVLGVSDRATFYLYRTGRTEPKASQAIEIEAVFAKYGVTENIWGKGDE